MKKFSVSGGPAFSRMEYIAVLIIITLGFCGMYFFASGPITDISGDSLVYNQLAINMLEGHGFSQCVTPPFTPSIARTPAYPAFLATVYFFFGKDNYEIVRILQILLMLIAAILVFRITMVVTGNKFVSFGALIITVLYGYKDHHGVGVYGYLITESLMIVLVNGSIYLMLLASQRKRAVYFMGLGILLALAMLTRPSNLFFPFIAALYLIGTQPAKRMVLSVGLMALVVAAIVLPWTIRNYRCFHTVIPLSLSLRGLCVYSGAVINNPDFLFYPGCDYRPNGFEPNELQKKRFKAAWDGYYNNFIYGGSGGIEIVAYDDSLKAIGLEIIKENKIAFIKKWVFRTLGHWHFADVANCFNGVHNPIGPVGFVKIMVKLMAAAIVGFGIFRFSRNVKTYALLLFPIYNTLIYTPFIPQLRYSLPSRSFIIILFAIGLWEILSRFRWKSKKDVFKVDGVKLNSLG